MSAIDIMAEKLDQELQERGVLLVSRADCIEIIRSVIDHASEVAKAAKRTQPEMGTPG
jgi:hypothetical protein